MSKRTSRWSLPTIIIAAIAIMLAPLSSWASAQSGESFWQEEFIDDPTLSEKPAATAIPATSPLTIKSNGEQTNVSVETNAIIAPYLGAVKKTPDAPADILPHLASHSDNPLDNYHLETGVGLKVNKLTEMNLGYRFRDTPTLLESPSNKTSEQTSGDLRFTLELKLPF